MRYSGWDILGHFPVASDQHSHIRLYPNDFDRPQTQVSLPSIDLQRFQNAANSSRLQRHNEYSDNPAGPENSENPTLLAWDNFKRLKMFSKIFKTCQNFGKHFTRSGNWSTTMSLVHKTILP